MTVRSGLAGWVVGGRGGVYPLGSGYFWCVMTLTGSMSDQKGAPLHPPPRPPTHPSSHAWLGIAPFRVISLYLDTLGQWGGSGGQSNKLFPSAEYFKCSVKFDECHQRCYQQTFFFFCGVGQETSNAPFVESYTYFPSPL